MTLINVSRHSECKCLATLFASVDSGAWPQARENSVARVQERELRIVAPGVISEQQLQARRTSLLPLTLAPQCVRGRERLGGEPQATGTAPGAWKR